MDAATLREVLKKEYGINNDKEFEAAVKKSIGIDIGIFTVSLTEKNGICEQKEEVRTIA